MVENLLDVKPAWLQHMILGLLLTLAVGIVGLMIWSGWLIATKLSPEERATYKARCHAAVNQAQYPAYHILWAKSDGCQIMLPEGGVPVNFAWDERYLGLGISWRP